MKKITIYGLSTCPWCAKARQYFVESHIPVDYFDYDRADAGTQARISREMTAANVTGFPFVRIDGHVIVGYNPEGYLKALAS